MDFQDLTLIKIPVIKVWSVDKGNSISFSFEVIIPVRCYNFTKKGDLSDVSMKPGGPVMEHWEAVDVAHPVVK